MSFRICLNYFAGRRLFCVPISCGNKSYLPVCLSTKVDHVAVAPHRSQRFYSSEGKANKGFIIYKGSISDRIRAVKIFSLSTSIAGMCMQPILLDKYMEQSSDFALTVFCGCIVQFFTFVTPFLFHFIAKRYITSISYDTTSDTYTATMYNFFALEKSLHFKQTDVEVPDISGVFSTITIKNRPFFLEMMNFSDIGHYKKIMGYDKPIDFKLMDKPAKE